MWRQFPREAAAFEGQSEALLSDLRSVLPPGWYLTPFGSYLQSTCLPGVALDVALVRQEAQGSASVPKSDHGIFETLVSALLHRTHAHTERPSQPSLDTAVGGGPLRLLARDCTHRRQAVEQGLAVYLGDASTGHLDTLLRRLLDLDAGARIFVTLVKRWARSRGLLDPVRGGAFHWTLVAVFALQVQGVLPPLRDFCAKGLLDSVHPSGTGQVIRGWPSARTAMGSPGAMLFRFADIILGHAERAEPRPRISLWTGAFIHQTASAAKAAAVPDQFAPCGQQVVRELRRLQEILAAQTLEAVHSDMPYGIWISTAIAAEAKHSSAKKEGIATTTPVPPFSSSHLGFFTPPRRSIEAARALPPIREAESPGMMSSSGFLERPPGSDDECIRYPELPPFPQESPSQEQSVSFKSVPPGVLEPSMIDVTGNVLAHSTLKWRIDESWVATCSRDGHIIEAVQFDPHRAGSLGRAGWERRIGRRLHQIRIGKATKEYRRWQEYFQCHGRADGDPETPRAVAQSSKKQFEVAYSEWRIGLHRDPPVRPGGPTPRS